MSSPRSLDAIPDDTLVGLRDRALIGVMVYTFARIVAVVNGPNGKYVRTHADGKWNDNLLAIERNFIAPPIIELRRANRSP
jgi:hypothetical protein